MDELKSRMERKKKRIYDLEKRTTEMINLNNKNRVKSTASQEPVTL